MDNQIMSLTFKANINNSRMANNMLAELSEILDKSRGKKLAIDFMNVQFIAANQLSVLAALFDDYCKDGISKIQIHHLNQKLKLVMQKNGFGEHLGLPKMNDIHKTTIPHRFFGVNQSNEFEKYILIYIFQREDIPAMSDTARHVIIDNFLEIFNNVKEHTIADTIHACGQFFPKSKMLYFTIVDIGKTIEENVRSYFEIKNINMQERYCIEWAIKEGNTTRMANSPGGLGLSVINQFIEMNEGELYVISGNEVYEFSKTKRRFFRNDYFFRGTIVTIGINMNDEFAYLAVNDNLEQIIF